MISFSISTTALIISPYSSSTDFRSSCFEIFSVMIFKYTVLLGLPNLKDLANVTFTTSNLDLELQLPLAGNFRGFRLCPEGTIFRRERLLQHRAHRHSYFFSNLSLRGPQVLCEGCGARPVYGLSSIHPVLPRDKSRLLYNRVCIGISSVK